VATDRAALGSKGEQRAADHLSALGWEILDRNYRCKSGEIDIIARDGGDIVFVEVKTRRTTAFGSPSDAVDRRKQGKIVKSAQHYLTERNLGEVDSRFDVVEIYFTNGQPIRVELIKSAFWQEG
jgi:putative endonuclease